MKSLLLIALFASALLAQGVLQNPALTPGAALTGNKAAVCWPGYAKTVRDVPEKTKRAVLASYGINCAKRDCGKLYEIDHLVSLELGGSNDIKNLWPQKYEPKPGARHKDQLEATGTRNIGKGFRAGSN